MNQDKPHRLENDHLQLSVDARTSEYLILHKLSGDLWCGPRGRLGAITLKPNDDRARSGFGRGPIRIGDGLLEISDEQIVSAQA